MLGFKSQTVIDNLHLFSQEVELWVTGSRMVGREVYHLPEELEISVFGRTGAHYGLAFPSLASGFLKRRKWKDDLLMGMFVCVLTKSGRGADV